MENPTSQSGCLHDLLLLQLLSYKVRPSSVRQWPNLYRVEISPCSTSWLFSNAYGGIYAPQYPYMHDNIDEVSALSVKKILHPWPCICQSPTAIFEGYIRPPGVSKKAHKLTFSDILNELWLDIHNISIRISSVKMQLDFPASALQKGHISRRPIALETILLSRRRDFINANIKQWLCKFRTDSYDCIHKYLWQLMTIFENYTNSPSDTVKCFAH